MTTFRVVEGRKSLRYNHFKEYRFESCIATNTRLMGVVALYITWRSRSSRSVLCQIMHLDYSEYGIDEYMEFYEEDSLRELSRITSRKELREEWERISGSLGGVTVRIPADAVLCLIGSALETNSHFYRNHDEEIRQFRKNTIARVQLMQEALQEEIREKEDVGKSDEDRERETIRLVSPKALSFCETINYFLMRLCDCDYNAAYTLCAPACDDIRNIPGWKPKMMTLLHTRIRSARDLRNPYSYYCEVLTQDDYNYYYVLVTIDLDLSAGKKHPLVSSLKCTYFGAITEVEMAMKMKHPEYVTVYHLNIDPEDFDESRIPMMGRAQLSPAPGGALYLLYNKDNSHVDSYNYFISDDIYGAYIITAVGELVMMSTEMMKITMMEMDIASSIPAGELEVTGRYKFDTQVFHTFIEMSGVSFRDILE